MNVEYKSISGFLLSCIKRKISNFVNPILKDKNISEADRKKRKNWLTVDIDVVFFVYAMDFRVRPTIILARIVQKIMKILVDRDNDLESLILKKIFDGANTVLRNHESFREQSSVEILNLLLIINKLGKEFKISEKRLIQLFFPKQNYFSPLCYFEWVSLMLISKNLKMYSELKRLLVENIKHKFQDKNWHMGYSEKIMLFLDFISCPFVNIDDKREIVSLLSLNEKDAPTAVDAKNELINSISGKKKWFVDWEDEDWLEKRLRKKEYTFPYN